MTGARLPVWTAIENDGNEALATPSETAIVMPLNVMPAKLELGVPDSRRSSC